MNQPFTGTKKVFLRWHNGTWRGRLLDSMGALLGEVTSKTRKGAEQGLREIKPAIKARMMKAKI
jgi:hypothetical protein